MTYAEYLKSQGASEDEIKILDTAAGRRAYDKMVSDMTEIVKQRDTINASATALETRVSNYYEDTNKKYKDLQDRLTVAEGNSARYRTALVEAQRQGLVDVAKDFGFSDDELKGAPARASGGGNGTPPSGFDPQQYFNRDEILKIADVEGDAIAASMDIASEHVYLFGSPLRGSRELREDAKRRKITFEQAWMEKFNVAKAREDRKAKDVAEHDEKIRKEARAAADEEWAKKISGNPDLRIPEPSISPFAPRTGTNARVGKQPWEVGTPEQLHEMRSQRGTEAVLKSIRPS